MKNIHLIPTDKPSRLGYLIKKGKEVFNDLRLFEKPMPNILDSENQHIYITNDEEIKEGDWVYNTISLKPEAFKACENGDGYVNCSKYSHYRIDCKKIILTTDDQLIADGIQAIDDEFLEWFVNNPSYEFVDVKKGFADGTAWGYNFLDYKIIIPKEEPKQEYVKCTCANSLEYSNCGKKCERILDEQEPKQETLEEAADKFSKELSQVVAFYEGAKWQQERMYSEEEIKTAMKNGYGIKYFSEHKFLENLKQLKTK
jgi:hypothetical protein